MTEWKTGDVITAERLNQMQKEPLIIHGIAEGSTVTLDKTWKEIKDAFLAGIPCVYDFSDEYITVRLCSCFNVKVINSEYMVTFYDGSSFSDYSTDSENGYPYYSYD